MEGKTILKVYGSRGSMPTAPVEYTRYGTNTSCYELRAANGERLILDAGSGLLQLLKEWQKDKFPINILLSHLHYDHTIGLATFAPMYMPGVSVNIYTADRSDVAAACGDKPFDGMPLKEQVLGWGGNLRWPVNLNETPDNKCIEVVPGETFSIGQFEIEPFLLKHPDKTIGYKIWVDGKSLVYLLDSELPAMSAGEYNDLVEKCCRADLVVFDCCYAPNDYLDKKGFGHSSIIEAIKLKNDSKCKDILLSHFDPFYSDEALGRWLMYPGAKGLKLAQEGLELEL